MVPGSILQWSSARQGKGLLYYHSGPQPIVLIMLSFLFLCLFYLFILHGQAILLSGIFEIQRIETFLCYFLFMLFFLLFETYSAEKSKAKIDEKSKI